MLQRKFMALGGVDMLVNFISISVNDDVIASAAAALRMLEESSKDACMRVLHMGGAAVLFVQLRRTRNVQVISSRPHPLPTPFLPCTAELGQRSR